MSRMNFLVAEECVRLGLRAGAIVFRNVHVTASNPVQRAEIMKDVAALRARFSSPKAVRRDPCMARFQSILHQVGGNLSIDRPSVSRLMSFALKRCDLPAFNNLLDAFTLLSI